MTAAIEQMFADGDEVIVTRPGEPAARDLIDIIPAASLRAPDALRLAAASAIGATAFATADNIQAVAAAALGLTVQRFCRKPVIHGEKTEEDTRDDVCESLSLLAISPEVHSKLLAVGIPLPRMLDPGRWAPTTPRWRRRSCLPA